MRATQLVIDEIRRRSRRFRLLASLAQDCSGTFQVNESVSPERRLRWMQRNAAIWIALGSLPSKYREPVVAIVIGSASLKEVARWLGCSARTARRRYQHGLERLGRMLWRQRDALDLL